MINCQDVNDPADLLGSSSWCWIKMAEVSVEGLRQAFLDPLSRIRLSTDQWPEEHEEFGAIAWEGGFLDGSAIRFNENLNVLIGGRGTGKSTVIESLRAVLQMEALGDDSRRTHEGIVREVLRNGTKISLLVRSYRPDKREYLIERTLPNPSVVKDKAGMVLPLTPRDVIPGAEIYGQHELAELAKSPGKLTSLLNRFLGSKESMDNRKSELKRSLQRSRRRIVDLDQDIKKVDERLETLPSVEETLRRYNEAGLEERLKEQSLLVREERVITTAFEMLAPFQEEVDRLGRALPWTERSFPQRPWRNCQTGNC